VRSARTDKDHGGRRSDRRGRHHRLPPGAHEPTVRWPVTARRSSPV
ncbi:MAG: hypothetical protein AVDCRST_MAG64-1783, partial [uncultured Phycisphaerae bacterium]